MKTFIYCSALIALSSFAGTAFAQDSTAKGGCLPGDALSPWDDASSPTGSVQKMTYVVDLDPFTTSWGTTFGAAPVMKSSRVGAQFTDNLLSAHTISRRMLKGVAFPSSNYSYWLGAGKGINGDSSVNDPGSSISPPTATGVQFAVAAAEFGGTAYNGVFGGFVNISPTVPSRLFVTRVVAAVNSCDSLGNVSQFGVGSVDAKGQLMLRADGFGTTGAGNCTGTVNSLVGDNIFRVDMAKRDATILNVVSNDWIAGGLFDKGTGPNFTTDWLVRGSATTHNTPGIAANTAGNPIYLGSNFNNQYLRGPTFGSITADGSHLAPGVTAHRGGIGYTTRNHPSVASTNGIAGIIGVSTASKNTILDVFGLDGSGNVTGKIALTMPAVIVDNATGGMNLPGTNEFSNYKSQVAFRGGNGQVALGVDAAGNLLAAAQADQPNIGTNTDWPLNTIAVARVTPTGAVSWTLAAYVDGTTGVTGTGKPVLDGSGAIIGRLVALSAVTGGAPIGPSLSSPMIDAVGNIWFLGGVEYFATGQFHTTLLRGVYDSVNFAFRLEAVLKTGQKLFGHNSQRPYLLTYMSIADSNSISSSTCFSHDISEDGYLGTDVSKLSTRDPHTFGGIVLDAGIMYDSDNNGTFASCNSNPPGNDQKYEVLLYIGYPGFNIERKPNGSPIKPI